MTSGLSSYSFINIFIFIYKTHALVHQFVASDVSYGLSQWSAVREAGYD
jgi:hypothetical protein